MDITIICLIEFNVPCLSCCLCTFVIKHNVAGIAAKTEEKTTSYMPIQLTWSFPLFFDGDFAAKNSQMRDIWLHSFVFFERYHLNSTVWDAIFDVDSVNQGIVPKPVTDGQLRRAWNASCCQEYDVDVRRHHFETKPPQQ